MTRRPQTLSLVGATLALTLILGSTAFAADRPITGGPVREPEPTVNGNTKQEEPGSGDGTTTTTSSSGGTTTSTGSSTSTTTGNSTSSSTTTTTTTTSSPLRASQLKICQARTASITTIMTRADTRAQNQIALFSAVATKVETYYASQGKTAANYSQLVSDVNAAETKATTDLGTLKGVSVFSCSANNPAGVISGYRSDLQAVQVDLQSLRTAIKSLIVGVAQAEGVTLSRSATAGVGQ